MSHANILVVEDEAIIGMNIETSLLNMEYQVLAVVESGEAALAVVQREVPDLAIIDISLQGQLDGIEVATQMRADHDIPIIYLTAYADEATLARARKTEPFGFILKPFQTDDLRSTIDMALYKHQLDHALKMSEARYRNLFENSPIPLWEVDCSGVKQYLDRLGEAAVSDVASYLLDRPADLTRCLKAIRIVDVNQATLDLLAADSKETLLENLARITFSETLDVVKRQLARLAAGRFYVEDECPARTLNGEHLFLNVSFSIAPDYHQSWAQVLLTVVDVTARRRAEAALRVSEERHRLISEVISDYAYCATVSADRQITTNWVTDAFERITGYALAEIQALDKGWSTLINSEDLSVVRQSLANVFDNQVIVCEYRILTKDGRQRWLRDHIRPIWDEGAGRVVRLIGGVQDITETKITQQALTVSEQKYRNFVTQARDGIVLTDEAGVVVDWNPAMARLTDLPAETVLGRPVWDAWFKLAQSTKKTPALYERIKRMIRAILAGYPSPRLGKVVEAEFVSARGIRHVVQEVFLPIQTDGGFILSIILREMNRPAQPATVTVSEDGKSTEAVPNRPAILDLKRRLDSATQAMQEQIALLGDGSESLTTAQAARLAAIEQGSLRLEILLGKLDLLLAEAPAGRETD